MRRAFAHIICASALLATPAAFAQSVILSDDEIQAALLHGPWPPEQKRDPSNRVSGVEGAIKLGEKLFFNKALSASGNISCATCHQPGKAFGDDLPRAMAHAKLDRNTQSLLNVSHQRWFGWDGRSDNLWAQSLLPIPRESEMALDSKKLADVLAADAVVDDYASLFGDPQQIAPEENLVNIGKALAAYIETLETGKTPFDEFRDALAAGDMQTATQYPLDAQRGFQLFAGKGNCTFCHTGALFSNGEFHDAGVPYFVAENRVDLGRFGGIEALLESPFNLTGDYNDEPQKVGAWKVNRLRRTHNDFGIFRVPSLREVGATAPYMHNGSLATLEDVVDHYSNINLDRLHSDGELILKPLNLNEQETADLVAFLRSLSETN